MRVNSFPIALIPRQWQQGKCLHFENKAIRILMHAAQNNTYATCIVQLAVFSHTVMQHNNSLHRATLPCALRPRLHYSQMAAARGSPHSTSISVLWPAKKRSALLKPLELMLGGHPSVYSLRWGAQAVLCRTPQAVALETFKERG